LHHYFVVTEGRRNKGHFDSISFLSAGDLCIVNKTEKFLTKAVRIHALGGPEFLHVEDLGSFAVQFAKAKGAYVIGTASAVNLEYLKQLGADEVTDYRSQ
jgi:hypothetical protein